jgi:hypothetical protein
MTEEESRFQIGAAMNRLHPRQKLRRLTALGVVYLGCVAALTITWIVTDQPFVALLAAVVIAVGGGALLMWGRKHGHPATRRARANVTVPPSGPDHAAGAHG